MRRNGTLLASILILVFLMIGVSSAGPVLDTATVIATVNMPPILEIMVSPEELVFTSQEILDGAQAGEVFIESFVVQKIAALQIDTSGNIGYELRLSTDEDEDGFFTSGEGGSLPVERLKWRLYDPTDDTGPWTALSTSAQWILDQPEPGLHTVWLDVELTVLRTDPIGVYSGTLVFTVEGDLS